MESVAQPRTSRPLLLALFALLVCPLKAQVTQGTWASVFHLAGAPGDVTALLADGDRLYAGGVFREMDGVAVLRVALFDGITRTWQPMGEGLDGQVFDLALSPEGDLYASGLFTRSGTVTVGHVARFNAAAQRWEAVGPPETNASAFVTALAFAPDGVLFAGGSFGTLGGVAARNVARWDGQAWSSMGDIGPTNVADLKVAHGRLYATGRFSTAGGIAAPNIAQWNLATQTWAPVGGGIPGSGVVLGALAADSAYVYVGGGFTQVVQADGTPVAVQNVARWHVRQERWEGLGTGAPRVQALTITPGGLFASGTDQGNAVVRQWDGLGWRARDLGPLPFQRSLTPIALASFAGHLVAGFSGTYTTSLAGPTSFLYTTPLSGGGWVPGALPAEPADVARRGKGLDGIAYALAPAPGGQVLVGGNFSAVGAQAAPYFAVWQGHAWALPASAPDAPVTALVVDSLRGIGYAGGAFEHLITPGDSSRPMAGVGLWRMAEARWEGPLGGGVSGQVRALALDAQQRVLIGGRELVARQATGESLTMTPLVRWDPGAARFEDLPAPRLMAVNALYVQTNGDVLAGGFDVVGGVLVGRVFRLPSGATGWEQVGADLPYDVRALLEQRGATGSVLLAGTDGGGVYAWSGSSWSPQGGPAGVFALTLTLGGDVLAGGTSLQRRCEAAWCAFEGGIGGRAGVAVYALARRHDLVWVGGYFQTAGPQSSAGIAQWRATAGTGLGREKTSGPRLEARVAPNPIRAHGTLTVEAPVGTRVRVAVYNVLGRQMPGRWEGLIERTRWTIPLDLEGWPAGWYTCIIEAEGQQTAVSLLLVGH